MKKVLSFLLILAICSGITRITAYAAVSSAPSIPEKLDIHIGSVPYYYMTVKNKVAGATYTFSSNNTKVVTCSKTLAAMTGIKEGTATITCTQILNKKKTVIGKCKVTVKKAVPAYKKYEIPIGYSNFCKLSFGNLNAEYTYISDNTEVLSIDNSGIYKALSEGKATVTIYESYNGKKRTVGTTEYDVHPPYIWNNTVDNDLEESVYCFYREKKLELYLDYNYSPYLDENSGGYGSYWYGIKASKFHYFYLPSIIYFSSSKESVPEYKFSVRDPEILSITDDSYIIPLKAGKTFLYCTVYYNGKSMELDRLPITITEKDIDDYYITTLLDTYDRDEALIKITEGFSMDLSKYIITDMNGKLVNYTSSDPTIVAIDQESGILSALKPGIVTIHIGNEKKFSEIKITVLEKNAMGKLEEEAETYIKRLNKLLETELTEENFEEFFCEFSEVLYFDNNTFRNYEVDYDYRDYIFVPNLTFCFDLGEKLAYGFPKIWDRITNVQRQIIEVIEVDDKTITIKFDKPFTKPEIIDMRYQLYFPSDDYNKIIYWSSCSIYDKTGSEITMCDITPQSSLSLEEGTNEITLKFHNRMRIGTYYISSNYYGFNPVKFEYK